MLPDLLESEIDLLDFLLGFGATHGLIRETIWMPLLHQDSIRLLDGSRRSTRRQSKNPVRFQDGFHAWRTVDEMCSRVRHACI